MGKITDYKRNRFSYLNAAKAENRLKIANQTVKKAGAHQHISDAFEEMKQLLLKTYDCNRNAELEILEAATQYVLNNQKCARAKKHVDALTDMMCHINLCQGQITMQSAQDMGFQSASEMSALTNSLYSFHVDSSKSGRTKWLNDTPQQTCLHCGDHSYSVDNSTRQQLSTFNKTRPSTQMGSSAHVGPTTQVGLAASTSNASAFASSIEYLEELQGFQSHTSLRVLGQQTETITRIYSASRYFPQNTTCVTTSNMMQDAQSVRQITKMSGRVNRSNIDAETNINTEAILKMSCLSINI